MVVSESEVQINALETIMYGRLAEIANARDDFWEFAKHVKTRNDNTGKVESYPIGFKYLHELNEFLDGESIAEVLKSRQMTVSFHMMLRQLWKAWRCDKKQKQSYFAGTVSKREEDVIELFDRVKFMYQNLPPHFREYNPLSKETQTSLTFKKGGKLKGLPASESIGRTFSFTDVFFDEFAYAPWDRKMWASLRPTVGMTGTMHAVSTPNGKFNLFHDMWTDTDHYRSIGRHRLHWSEHPERDEKWAQSMRESMPEDVWNREYELSFATMAGKRVYPEFKPQFHVSEFDYVPSRELIIYETWDFGYRHPAVLWSIKNKADQLLVVDEFQGDNIDTHSFACKVLEKREALFPNCLFREFCDVTGRQRRATPKAADARSDVEVLNKLGIRPRAKLVGIRQGGDIVRRMLWPLRKDGHPWMVVHPRCQILIDGFQGGYSFEDNDKAKEEPVKDGYYDHLQDCIRYTASFLFPELTGQGPRGGRMYGKHKRKYEEYARKTDEYGGY